MENDIVDSLDDLGYNGPLVDVDVFCAAVEEGTNSVDFTKLVEWLTTELAELAALEDHVRAVSGPEDAETFLMELSGFLREYGCPYKDLSEGPVTQRLATVENKFRLLNYLATELQASRMLAVNKPHLIVKSVKSDAAENPSALLLKQMLMALGFPKPPEGITPFALFSKVETKIKDILTKIELAHLSKPLLKARLSDKQWESIQYINEAMNLEYELRRQMLVQRLEVTIQSFLWSDKAKISRRRNAQMESELRLLADTESYDFWQTEIARLAVKYCKLLDKTGDEYEKQACKQYRDFKYIAIENCKKKEEQVQALYNPIKGKLLPKVNLDLAFLLASREDLLRIEKTSGGSAREKTKCNINRVLIGNVPDRGGRAYELEIPPPEMPSFQQRQHQPQQQRDGGGGRGGRGHDDGHHRGGDRVRGGWGDSRSGGAGGWNQNQVQYGAPQPDAGATFFGGSGGAGFGPAERGRGGHRQGGHHQDAYQQGGYQQGGYQQGGFQPGYQQGGYQQGGYQQGGHQQGGYQQGGYQQGGSHDGGYRQDNGYHDGFKQDRPQSGQDYHSRGGGGRGGQSGGRGGGGRGRGSRR